MLRQLNAKGEKEVRYGIYSVIFMVSLKII